MSERPRPLYVCTIPRQKKKKRTSNRNKKTLLPLPRLHQRPLHNRIRTTNPDPLRRSRTLQTQHIPDTVLAPGRPQRVADGEEDAAAHEERGFADAAGALDGAEVVPLDALEQAHVEDLGDVAEAGDLVGSRPAREELARGAVPEAFFRGEEALALDEGAFDLAVVDGRVDGAADVHEDVGAQAGPVAG